MKIPLFFALAVLLAGPALVAQTAAERAEEEASKLAHEADLKLEKGDYDGAIANWTRIVGLLPGEFNPLFERGQIRVRKNDLEGAIADFSAAIKLTSDHEEYYYERGRARLRINEPAAAIADFSMAIRLRPNEAALYAERGRAYARLNQAGPALVDFGRAIAFEPNSAVRRLDRAGGHRNLGNLREAMVDVNAAVGLDPRLAGAYVERGVLLQAEGNLDGALANYRQAIALSADQRYAHFWRFLVQKQKRQDGFPDLARAVAKWPESWGRSVGLYLIESLSEKEFLARAAAGSGYLRREQLSEAHYYVGMVALIAGNTTKARDHLQKCVAQGVRYFYEDVLANAQLKALK